ncbi:LOW QUALITY PROTEIN: SWI/SNF-related matrix-associated actin-dependent regulator of chromatin subfamily A-like protein 1 [Saccostrea cucullata]|uniref:LOW QUALITY PROTEIN: SWI/SNF-related matrix-associated actin-dependent regulator of chromatin subfamily A-like protein 1 n=1 Tax=Saccostrea cuccullata TaxID=36930 RepID=UPI002ED606CD
MSSLTEEQKRRIEENKRKALAKRAEKRSPVKCGIQNQKQRIEENRQRALALRAEKHSPVKDCQFKSVNNSTGNERNGTTSQMTSSSSTFYNQQTCAPNSVKQRLADSYKDPVALGQNKNTVKSGIPCNSYSRSNNTGDSNNNKTNASNTGLANKFKTQGNQSKFNKPVSQGSSQDASEEKLAKITECIASSGGSTQTTLGGGTTAKCLLISRERFEVTAGYYPPLIDLFKTIATKKYDAVTRKWSFKLEDYHKLVAAMRSMSPQVKLVTLPQAILSTFQQQLKGIYPDREIPTANLDNLDQSLVNSLLPFQREGVDFGVHKQGRVLIADDMGLGKTIQAICLACYYRNEWPLLIVVPSSVRFDWAQQLERWVPSLDPQEVYVAMTGKCSLSGHKVCILSYELMAKKAKELLEKNFNVVIMDECHLLKNFKTARCKAAMPILKASKRVILLSGTPALSRPQELYTQICAIKPYMFQYQDFGVRYCDGKKNPWGWDFSGSSNMEELQILLEESIMIRRLKKDVLTQLPDKVRQMVLLDPGSVKTTKQMEQQSKTMELKSLKGMERRGALLEYFHHTGAAKIKAIKDYVLDLLDSDKKFLIFAHHQEVLDAIETAVESKIEKGYIRIDGKTTPEQRNFFCKKFQTKDSIRVAILSICAANAGLNLSAASLVVFGELFWNPGILVQAEDRAHRMGQRDMVNVHYLVARGTADDHVWPLVQKKLEVLSKAGLSKEDFSAADTKHITDSKQTDLMQFFEESFMEESVLETSLEEDNQSKPADEKSSNKNQETNQKLTNQNSRDSKLSVKPVKPKSEQSLFNYFGAKKDSSDSKPGTSSVSKDSVIDNIEDDLLFDDDEWLEEMDEPKNKKLKC